VDRYEEIADPTRRTYAGMVACLDDEIGKVVAALDKKDLRENTLIVFHSDNGGTTNAMFAGQMADVSKIKLPCDNGPYRGGKGELFEGGCLHDFRGHLPGPGTEPALRRHHQDFQRAIAQGTGAPGSIASMADKLENAVFLRRGAWRPTASVTSL
jgi:arylsulfatase A-like enzyme